MALMFCGLVMGGGRRVSLKNWCLSLNFHLNSGMLWAHSSLVIFSPRAHNHTFRLILSWTKMEKLSMLYKVSMIVWLSCPYCESSILYQQPWQMTSWLSLFISFLVTSTNLLFPKVNVIILVTMYKGGGDMCMHQSNWPAWITGVSCGQFF